MCKKHPEEEQGCSGHECIYLVPDPVHLSGPDTTIEYFLNKECTNGVLPGTPEMNEAMAATIIERKDFEDILMAPLSNCPEGCYCRRFDDYPSFVIPPKKKTEFTRRVFIRKLNITGMNVWVKFTYSIRWTYYEGICVPKPVY